MRPKERLRMMLSHDSKRDTTRIREIEIIQNTSKSTKFSPVLAANSLKKTR